MDHYMEWVEASSLAYRVKSWATPLKVFGYLTVALAAAILLFGLLFAFTTQAFAAAAPAVAVSSLLISLVLLLQGSVIVMIATYAQMRAQETIARTSQILAGDEK